MIKIPLTKGKFAIVDREDLARVSSHSWQFHSMGYATSGGSILLHRLIMGAKKGQMVDHINRDKLDNRKANLRFCSHRQNSQNRKAKGYCIEKRTGKFYSQIKVDDRRIHLGTFETKEQAISAYRRAAKAHFGEFHNKIGGLHEAHHGRS